MSLWHQRQRPTRLHLGAGLLLGLLAVFAALLLSGVVALPDVEAAILAVGPALGQWTYVLVAALTFLETGTFVGLFVPGEATIVLGGLVAGQGVIRLELLVPIVWTAAVAGDVTSYWLGRRLGRRFLLHRGPRVGVTPARLEWAERYFAAHGGKTVVIGRFLGVVRALAPFLAGASNMRFRRFLAFDVIGAGLWATTFCVLGWIFWQSLDRALELAVHGKAAVAAGIVLLLGALLLKRIRQHARTRVAKHETKCYNRGKRGEYPQRPRRQLGSRRPRRGRPRPGETAQPSSPRA